MIIQWVIWSIFLLITFCFLFGIRNDLNNKKIVHIVLVIQTELYFLFSFLFFLFPWNKFHLIWIAPSIILGSQIFFVILRIPFVGKIFRIIFVSIANVLLFGLQGTIQGVPKGK